MRRLISFVLIAFLLALVAACADRTAEAQRLWTLSVDKLNQGDIHAGLKAARDLRSYDSDKSIYLVGQYMVYGAGSHGGNFSMGLERFYKEVLSIEIKANNPYAKQMLASKLFALRFLEGPKRAAPEVKEACGLVGPDNTDSCMAALVRDAESRYMRDPSRFNALYLYQAARVGEDFGGVNTDNAHFLEGLALFKMDYVQARYTMGLLDSHHAITKSMVGQYCQLATELQLDVREGVCALRK